MNKKILLINELNRNNRDAYLNSVSIVSAFGDRAYTCIDENIKYDAVITGYIKDSDYILNIREHIADLKLDNNRVLTLIDPCFADSGIKYDGITDNHISNFKKLLELSDIMTPNLTEACMLVNEPYEKYREKYCTIVYEGGNKDKINELSKKIIESIFPLLEKLRIKKNQITIITGIELYNSVLTILDVYDGDHGKRQTTCNYSEKIEDRSGVGEIFNTMFFETSTNGFNLVDSLSASTSFVNNSLRFSRDNNFDKKYGIIFEPILYDNVNTIKQRLIDIKNNIKNKE